jgi:hypothetical protein
MLSSPIPGLLTGTATITYISQAETKVFKGENGYEAQAKIFDNRNLSVVIYEGPIYSLAKCFNPIVGAASKRLNPNKRLTDNANAFKFDIKFEPQITKGYMENLKEKAMKLNL